MSDGLSLRLDAEQLDQLAEAVAPRLAALLVERDEPEPASSYLIVQEAADYLRCSRQRIDDLLSQRRLTRHKDGSRTLLSRAEIERYVEGCRSGLLARPLPAGGRDALSTRMGGFRSGGVGGLGATLVSCTRARLSTTTSFTRMSTTKPKPTSCTD